MGKNYKIYKALVTDIVSPSQDGKRKREILITPRQNSGAGTTSYPASPPSWIPTSVIGSGVTSFPDKGQECLVAEGETGERHIISYTQPQGISPYGSLLPERDSEGGVSFGVRGMHDALIKMDRKGSVSLLSNLFAQVKVSGASKTVLIKGYNTKNEYAGGYLYNLYDKNTQNTTSKALFTRKFDNPGFSDQNLRTEQSHVVTIPATQPPYRYVDKVIIKSGEIFDNSIYNFETRQNIASVATGKDVFTNFRVGYQKNNERFPGKPNYPEGTVLEWTAKTNIAKNISTFTERFGKLQDDPQKFGVKGEVYRFSILEGLNNNKIYGDPLINTIGEGEGYLYSKNSNAIQQFTKSFGLLADTQDSEQAGSVFREFIHHKTSNNLLFSKKLLGGDQNNLIFRHRVGKNELFIENELKEETNGEYSLIYSEDDTKEVLSLKKGFFQIKSHKDVFISINEEEIMLKTKNSELKLTPDGLYYNGLSLVFETLVDWLHNNKSSFGMGNLASPVPLFPAALATFDATKALGHTSKGFLTKTS